MSKFIEDSKDHEMSAAVRAHIMGETQPDQAWKEKQTGTDLPMGPGKGTNYTARPDAGDTVRAPRHNLHSGLPKI